MGIIQHIEDLLMSMPSADRLDPWNHLKYTELNVFHTNCWKVKIVWRNSILILVKIVFDFWEGNINSENERMLEIVKKQKKWEDRVFSER